MLFNRNDCSYKTEKKLDETLRIIRRVFIYDDGTQNIKKHYENLNKSVAKIK